MARERYLLDGKDDTIHSNVIELTTAKEKRKNWWHYHKIPLFAGLAAAAFAVFAICSVAFNKEPDYSVALLTSYTVPDKVKTALEDQISKYADDRNNDGKVKVRVRCYAFPDPTANLVFQGDFVRFAGDADMNASMIYIFDKSSWQVLAACTPGFIRYNSGEPMPDGAMDFENASHHWSEYAALNGFAPDINYPQGWNEEVAETLFSRLYVAVRASEGSIFENDEKKMDYYRASLEYLERLRTATEP